MTQYDRNEKKIKEQGIII